MQHFIRKHPVQSILLTLLAAYGLWWLGTDLALRTYPQRVANAIPTPPGVELVATDTGYSRKCKSAGMIQYFTTNQPWDKIVAHYTSKLQETWQLRGDGTEFYQEPNIYERLYFGFHHIDPMQEEYQNKPLLKQGLLKGATAYSIQVSYNQDLRVYEGICKPED